MGAYYNGIHISGNFNKLSKRKPKNWIETGYKIIVPYKFQWREKIGGVECSCQLCEEHYAPYYGVSFYHIEGFAYVNEFKKRPQLCNLLQYQEKEIDLICTIE